MKEAILTDLNGYYVEPELVPLETEGVTEIYSTPAPTEEAPHPEAALIGYRVAVPVPPGLYRPRFDVTAWRAALNDYAAAMDAYHVAIAAYDPESGGPQPQPPKPIDARAFWVEGLSQAEIDALRTAPQPETLEQKLARLESTTQQLDSRTACLPAVSQTAATSDERSQAMQAVDDYILGLVFAQQATIDAQAQQIANLLQRVEQLEGGAGS
jgi:hypothetical protein